MKNQKIKYTLLATAVSVLTACGGGGNTTPPVLSIGYFLDSAVGGVRYETATQTGITSADGSFKYVAGEDITFSVGAIKLPSVIASSQITPLDIAGTSDLENPKLVNILVFLQSIDSDGDPSNGISVPIDAATNATTALDFTNTTTAFSAQKSFTDFVATIPGATVKSTTVAKAHFAQTVSTKGIPVAPNSNAGVDQNVVTNNSVILDGSASSDINGDSLTYSWSIISKPSGSSVSLIGSTTVKPSFTPDVDGDYVISLLVNDGKFSSSASSTKISASSVNVAPTAIAGSNQSVATGSLVSLDGSASKDANGDPITYIWTITSKPFGSSVVLTNATSTKPSFTPDIDGDYVVSLIVSDGKLTSKSTSVTVTAATVNVPPNANAGIDQTAVTGTLVKLDGRSSNDANGDSLTYAWSLSSKPVGSSVSLINDNTSAEPTFTPDVDGTYIFSLKVSDGKLTSSTDNVSIIANTIRVVGTSYHATNGLDVTLDSITITDLGNGYSRYSIAYTQTNPSAVAIDEGSFKLYYSDGTESEPQYGFFNKVYPGTSYSVSRQYSWNVINTAKPLLIQYHQDQFFNSSPISGALQWRFPIK